MNKIKIVNDEIKIINLNNSIEYEIKDHRIIHNYVTLKNIDYNEYAKFNIKVIKMEQGYSKIKILKYKNELKILKEKYNIKETV